MGSGQKTAESSSNTNNAVVFEAKRRLKFHVSKAWQKVLVVVAVVALLVAVAAVLYAHFNRQTPIPPGLTTTQAAEYLANVGDYKGAERVWQKQYDKTADVPGKLAIRYQQVNTAIHFKKYDDAKKYAAEAMSLDSKSYIPYSAYAEIAKAQGQTATARKYYQETIAHIDPNLDAANLIKQDYQTKLDELK